MSVTHGNHKKKREGEIRIRWWERAWNDDGKGHGYHSETPMPFLIIVAWSLSLSLSLRNAADETQIVHSPFTLLTSKQVNRCYRLLYQRGTASKFSKNKIFPRLLLQLSMDYYKTLNCASEILFHCVPISLLLLELIPSLNIYFFINLFIYVFIHLHPSYHGKINNGGENRSAI